MPQSWEKYVEEEERAQYYRFWIPFSNPIIELCNYLYWVLKGDKRMAELVRIEGLRYL